MNEAQTRVSLIDPFLKKAGWDVKDRTLVGLEIPVDGYDAEPWNGITDYILKEPSGDIIAVVEAKKQSRSPRDADEQLRHYVTEIAKRQAFAPFGFMTNGRDIWFWEVGDANPRQVAGFFSPSDLARLKFIKQNAQPLQDAAIDPKIVERPYQHEAIRRVAETFSVEGKRRALLVMATGTGKTRTTMALIDLFLRTKQAQNILFLADRDALVDQALKDGFKIFLPNEPRTRIYTGNIDKTQRLYVATEQTMSIIYQEFTPSFFDLIILDEAHRSIFKRFTEVIDYFDGKMVGLTATPATFIDRNTFQVFQCGKNPTFLYTYEQAIMEKYLVDFNLYKAQTGYQRKGIKGVDLSEDERNALMEQGIDPDTLDYSGSDLEKTVTNRDTLRKQWEEIMELLYKDEAGLPGKTIVFAITQDHARRLHEVFEEMFPQMTDMARVITSTVERVRDGTYGDGLITKFKKNDKPRIAISVDMLDTGVDVPEVVNLVFMKPVQSAIKLWQMIGRGTRNDEACRFKERLPGGKKSEFRIIDFWENDFNKKFDQKVPQDIPVLVRLFNTRLNIAEKTIADSSSYTYKYAVTRLREMVNRIPVESFPVKKLWNQIDQAWQEGFWLLLTSQKMEFLKFNVGPLLRFAGDVDVAAETFISKMERLRLQSLDGDVRPDLLQSIGEDVSRLPDDILESKAASVKFCLSENLPKAAPEEITRAIDDLAKEMKRRREKPSPFLALDLQDFIAFSGLISIGEGGKQIYVDEYKKRVEAKVLEIIDSHPVIEAIRTGREVTDLELVSLERVLHTELATGDLQVTTDNIRRAYGYKVESFLGFLRKLLATEEIPDYSMVVQSAFTKHISAHAYSADQIRFLRAVQDVFLQKRTLDQADLYEAPLTSFGRHAADRLFSPAEISEIVKLAEQLAA